jgi:beta-fructofuranosidase
LVLPDHWVWDFWIARDEDVWHIFYLKAPKSLGDPDLRHRNATIGHGISGDLTTWEIVPDPIGPGHPGEWDDAATWTGSVMRVDDVWWMFYTGVSSVEDGRVQRIGGAVSGDLMTWSKLPENPIRSSDPRWYEQYDRASWYEEAWRDPWVFPDPDGDGFHMFVTARASSGPVSTRGVIGHAVASDLVEWSVRRPVFAPESFGHMEVPQQVTIDGRHYVIYSLPGDMQPGVRPEDATTGIGYAIADQPTGPFRSGPAPFVFADHHGSLSGGRIVFVDDRPMMLATLHHGSDGGFRGEISNPMAITVAGDGGLSLSALSG